MTSDGSIIQNEFVNQTFDVKINKKNGRMEEKHHCGT